MTTHHRAPVREPLPKPDAAPSGIVAQVKAVLDSHTGHMIVRAVFVGCVAAVPLLKHSSGTIAWGAAASAFAYAAFNYLTPFNSNLGVMRDLFKPKAK